jgi:asparagine synthase (glutamine-hydrolysing)
MILPISQLMTRAVEQTLEDRVAIAFSGGLDSSIIATIAKKHSAVELFTAGTDGCEDLRFSKEVAAELGLPLCEVPLDDKAIMDAYAACHAMLKLGLNKIEILVPVYCAAQAAAKKGHTVMLFGSGAEELFVGYERYFTYRDEGKDLDPLLREEFRTLVQRDIAWVKRVCRNSGIEARFPFYHKALAEAAFAIPLEERMHDRELKKMVLREAGKMLGVPEIALSRRKKAMQYGAGVHKVVLRHADEINSRFKDDAAQPR